MKKVTYSPLKDDIDIQNVEGQSSCKPTKKCFGDSPVSKANKNLYGLALCIFANSCAFLGLQNIQSSVNSDEGLGLVSLAVLYAGYMVSAIMTVGMVRSLGSRSTVIVGVSGYLIYTVLNYHPSWGTLIPGSFIAGLGTGPIFIAGNCHVIALADKMAPILNERKEILVSKYIGLVYLAYQLSTPPGNVAASAILLAAENYTSADGNATNDRSCGLLESFTVDRIYLYILVSVYVVLQGLSMVAAFVFIDNAVQLPSGFKAKTRAMIDVSTVRKVFDWKMLLLAPMGIYHGIELSFVTGAFAQVFISDCLGVSKVGFILMAFGIASGVMCTLYGRIIKYIPECWLMLTAMLVHAGLIVMLLLWKREPNYVVVLTFVILWGLCDAVWQITYSGFIASLFPEDTVPPFGASRVWIGLGLSTGFVVSHFSSKQRDYRISLYVTLALETAGALSYIVSVIATKRVQQQAFICCAKRQETAPRGRLLVCSTADGTCSLSNDMVDGANGTPNNTSDGTAFATSNTPNSTVDETGGTSSGTPDEIGGTLNSTAIDTSFAPAAQVIGPVVITVGKPVELASKPVTIQNYMITSFTM